MGRPHKKNGSKKTKKYIYFAECQEVALGKEGIFTECRALALGKGPLCRVPGPALGKEFFFKFDGVGGRGRQVPFFLPSATLCRVLHSAKRAFAECRPLPSAGHSVALGKATLCRVLDFAECHPVRHSTKSGFAECPIFGTRQSWRHSANMRSPVVIGAQRMTLVLLLLLFLKSISRCERSRCERSMTPASSNSASQVVSIYVFENHDYSDLPL